MLHVPRQDTCTKDNAESRSPLTGNHRLCKLSCSRPEELPLIPPPPVGIKMLQQRSGQDNRHQQSPALFFSHEYSYSFQYQGSVPTIDPILSYLLAVPIGDVTSACICLLLPQIRDKERASITNNYSPYSCAVYFHTRVKSASANMGWSLWCLKNSACIAA